VEVPPDPRNGSERRSQLAQKALDFHSPPLSKLEKFFQWSKDNNVKPWPDGELDKQLERLAKKKGRKRSKEADGQKEEIATTTCNKNEERIRQQLLLR